MLSARALTRPAWPPHALIRRVRPVVTVPLGFAPILDTERGVVAGYSTMPGRGATVDAGQLAEALRACAGLPRNTFLSIPLDWATLATPAVQSELLRPSDLSGIVFELVGVPPDAAQHPQSRVAASIQGAGGLIALQADDIWNPDFHPVTDHQPNMIVMGSSWVHRIDEDPQRQLVIETLGEIAGQRDAWLLASSVSTADEIVTLTSLGVPLARGSAVGAPGSTGWAGLAPSLPALLGPQRPRRPGPLRDRLVSAPTAASVGAATSRLLEPGMATPHVVVIDQNRHPSALVIRTAGGVRATDQLLRVHVDTDLASAASRSAARKGAADPLVAIDSAGRFLGLVPVASLT